MTTARQFASIVQQQADRIAGLVTKLDAQAERIAMMEARLEVAPDAPQASQPTIVQANGSGPGVQQRRFGSVTAGGAEWRAARVVWHLR